MLVTLVGLVVTTVGAVTAILRGDAPTVFAPVMGAFFAVLIILAITALVRGRIILTAQEIVVQGLVAQRRSRSRVAEVVRATIVAPRAGATESLFLLDAHRNLVIRVSGYYYTRRQLDQLVNALGVPCSGPSRPVNANQLAKTYPGLVSRVQRHPSRIAFAIVACSTVIALVAVWIATAS
ncbi:hypothetical protein [Planotetraspora kaengkrachanensis]|uniref:PH domain-containing protein n=1 Tax=Planotetraspora kaengkrachanensis TaxID=575193 RepID=A0A8J3PSD1_9ACTN|nr:hypothetical protein [Planotetraspora kaengkrachanensis]GIG80761.1 hypothetical protein Pka01_38880 [Planotetraspora kaengkrachanensis]